MASESKITPVNAISLPNNMRISAEVTNDDLAMPNTSCRSKNRKGARVPIRRIQKGQNINK